ncbi:carbon monoxide dehydrogenase [Clostridiales bacterium PH28_bin88]|nr:carbon monoxide dehydrogenase [Clostridiales bacterium PH28_bin88]
MNLPDFDYYNPGSVHEACEILARFGSKAKVLAGGTDLIIKMKHEVLAPQVLVSLKNISQLSAIEHVPGKGVVIGARATLNDLVNTKVLHKKFFSVSMTAHQMANNQIRNAGTIGGNIVNAVPSADLPPILIALGTVVKLVGPGASRSVTLEEFFTGPNQSVIAQDEILTEILIPEQPTTGSTYLKFGLRRSGALAVVGVAAAVTMKQGIINNARIVLGAVAPIPMKARKTEELLAGKVVTDDLLDEAGVCAAGECKPISDIRGSEEYRREMIRVFTKRALRKAIKEGHA